MKQRILKGASLLCAMMVLLSTTFTGCGLLDAILLLAEDDISSSQSEDVSSREDPSPDDPIPSSSASDDPAPVDPVSPDDTLDLMEFSVDKDYQLRGVPWDITPKELEQNYSRSVTKQVDPMNPNAPWQNYITDEPVRYSGEEGKINFSFEDGKLAILHIYFEPEDPSREMRPLFDKMLRNMEAIYGKSGSQTKFEYEGTKELIKEWVGPQHTLALQLTHGKTNRVTVTICPNT